MISEKVSRYFNSALLRPNRALVAGFSEITNIPLLIEFQVEGDKQPLIGKLPDAISRYMYLMEGIREYEPETTIMMKKMIKPGDTVLIIGAHIGVHAVLAKHLAGKEGIVIGFEPTPETFSLLQKNCEHRDIVIESMAITTHDVKEIKMTTFDTRHAAWNTAVRVRSNKSNCWRPKDMVVPATSIDSYCETKEFFPDIFILDLENGEMGALLGGEKVIRSRKPNIIIECGDSGREQHNSTNACLSLLRRWGYEFYEVNSQTGNFFIHEVKPSYPNDYPNVLAIEKSKSV